MKKELRIKKSSEIEAVLKKRESVGNKYFAIYKKGNDYSHYRVALSVGKKFGNAVHRNEMKRRLRYIINTNSKLLIDYDIFIIVKPLSKELSYAEINKHIIFLLRKHKLIKGEKYE